ncbi:DUF309 domain-containing protein [Halobaculum sp. MBLA0147]|uniref:DUF309 domain-containing protein n=1 Tax=Halobaculum sp. MBLA0147 TaxID=3079934 RepID=UPI003524B497
MTDRSDEKPAESAREAGLAAGLALYADGRYHATHDPWEAVWLPLDEPTDSDDEPFFHGLIQVTAAVHHGRTGTHEGASGLAASAREYLAPLTPTHRGVTLGPALDYCRRLAADPVVAERVSPPPLSRGGGPVSYRALSPAALERVVAAVADETEYDASVLTDAATFATRDAAATDRPALSADSGGSADAGDGGAPFASLLVDFLDRPDARPVVFQRLSEHVARRRQAVDDVRGLFE